MASATAALPSGISGLPKTQAAGSKNRSTTPAPKVSPKVNKGGVNSKADGKGLDAISVNILRAGFLRKVYGLLALQLVFTVTMASICMLTPFIRDTFLKLAQSHTWGLQLAIMIPSMASLLVLNLGMKDKYPANYVLLFLFTLGISLQVCCVCSVYHALGYTHLILQAAGATAVIFLGLSAYVLYSGKDFSFLGGFLTMMLWGLVVVGIGAMFFPWLTNSLLSGFVGALIFCGYILYDTWRIQKQFSYDDYIGATIEIYLDVVNLFLHILKFLIAMQEDKNKKKKN